MRLRISWRPTSSRSNSGSDSTKPRAVFLPTFEQKRQVYGALRDWLLVGTVDDVGPKLMEVMTEIETADLHDADLS